MKRILTSLFAIVALVGMAQTFQQTPSATTYSFLIPGIRSVVLTNQAAVYSGGGITNLKATLNNLHGTNRVGLVLTNETGRVVVSQANGYTTVNLLQDVPLWARRDGSPPFSTHTNNGAGTWIEGDTVWSDINLVLETGTVGASVTASIQCVFKPLYDGEEHPAAGATWTFTSPALTASARNVIVTNVPVWKWQGATGLRLVRVISTDTGGSDDVPLEKVAITGFR